MTRAIPALLVFAGLLTATEAQAQLFRKAVVAQPTTYQVATYPGATPSVATIATPATRIYSYSYYTRSTLPARTYVGYGNNDFPYYGAPYGHPYDPWTWPAMSGSYQASLARYYSPPLK